jgi:hypothetical protein
MDAKRDLLWLLAALAFGALLLPFLIYQTGALTLGPYSRGGAGIFYRDFLGSLGAFEWPAWLLLLGPALIVVFWRILRRVFGLAR